MTLPSLPSSLQGFDLDRALKGPAVAETTAYSAMLTDRLLPALVSILHFKLPLLALPPSLSSCTVGGWTLRTTWK